MVLTIVSAETPSIQAHSGARGPSIHEAGGRPLLLARLHSIAGGFGLARWNYLFDAKKARPPKPQAVSPKPSRPARPKRLRPRAHPPAKPRSRKIPVPKARKRAYQRQVGAFLRERKRTDRYDRLVVKYAKRHGLDPRLVKSLIAAESSFRRSVRSRAGAVGLMQLMPATAKEMGVASNLLTDPESNIRAGTAYLAHLFKRVFKRYAIGAPSYARAPQWIVRKVLAAYNAGPRFLYRTKLYRATRRYVERVLHFYGSKLARLRGALAAHKPRPALYVKPLPIKKVTPIAPPKQLPPSKHWLDPTHFSPLLPY